MNIALTLPVLPEHAMRPFLRLAQLVSGVEWTCAEMLDQTRGPVGGDPVLDASQRESMQLIERIHIDVEDSCGGLCEGDAESMFQPFVQRGADRSGAGLGLSISRRSVEAHGGRLSVRNDPGQGCVFTIELPRYVGLPAAVDEGLVGA